MKVCTRVLASAIGLGVLLALASTTRASPIVYDASGSFDSGQYKLGGTVEFGTASTNESLFAPDLTITSAEGFGIYGGPPTVLSTFGGGSGSPTDFAFLSLGPEVGMWLGYQVGPLLPNTPITLLTTGLPNVGVSQLETTFGDIPFDGGSLTPAVSAPEPATITLLASSFAAAGGFGLYRPRRERSQLTPAC